MPSSRHLRLAALALVVAVVMVAFPASAQDDGEPVAPVDDPVVKACLDSFDSSQKLRSERKLLDAKRELVACSQQSCPGVVVVKCQQWLEEVRESIPTVVIAARDNKKDIFDVKVWVDDGLVYESLTGTALELDPGPRKIAAVRGEVRRERTVLIREGQKNRSIELDFSPPKPPPTPPTPRPLPEPIEPIEPSGPGFSLPILSWVGFGIGLVGVIVGSITGGVAISEGDKLQAACQNLRCTESFEEFGPGETIAHVSTVSFAVAGAGIALGVVGLIVGEDDDSCPVSTFGVVGRF